MKAQNIKNTILLGTILFVSFTTTAQNWLLIGNNGTNPSSNFVGTRDFNDLAFRTDNTEWMRLSTGGFLGIGTTTPGYHLDVNGDINFASGYALKIGGNDALRLVTSNAFLFGTAGSITTGTGNFFLWGGGANTTSGSSNNFLGGGASNISGNNNNFFGVAGTANTNGSNNNFLGYGAGAVNVSGSNNNFFGNSAGYLTEGSDNNFIGNGAGYAATGGNENTFIGKNAGYSNTTGVNNIFLGTEAGLLNTDGGNNFFAGLQAGLASTSSGFNIFMGYQSGYYTNSNYNTFLGYKTGQNFTSGGSNVAIGFMAGGSGGTGSGINNVIIGSEAGASVQNGINNIVIGPQSGQTLSSGDNNTGIGYLTYIEDGTDNLVIGHFAKSLGGLSNSNAIGYQAVVTTDNTMSLGGTSTDAVDVLIGYTATSGYQLDVNGTTRNLSGSWVTSDNRFKKNITPINGAINSIMKLNPVKYEYKENITTINDKGDTSKLNFIKGNQIGFIAQELEEVIPELVNTDNNGYKAVNYAQMVSVLVQGIKEQQIEIEKQNSKIEELTKQIAGSNNNNGTSNSTNQLDQSVLYQNVPNPFSETTIIKYHLNNVTYSSSILVFDLNGTLLKTYNLNLENKDSEIKINSGDLKPGMYIYSLLADNKEVDTKKMIIAK